MLECKVLIVTAKTGSILFTSNPPGADIHLGAKGSTPIHTYLKTPNTVPNLPAGDYDYIIKFPGYNDYSGTITVKSEYTNYVIATLSIYKHPLVPILVSVPIIILIIGSI